MNNTHDEPIQKKEKGANTQVTGEELYEKVVSYLGERNSCRPKEIMEKFGSGYTLTFEVLKRLESEGRITAEAPDIVATATTNKAKRVLFYIFYVRRSLVLILLLGLMLITAELKPVWIWWINVSIFLGLPIIANVYYNPPRTYNGGKLLIRKALSNAIKEMWYSIVLVCIISIIASILWSVLKALAEHGPGIAGVIFAVLLYTLGGIVTFLESNIVVVLLIIIILLLLGMYGKDRSY